MQSNILSFPLQAFPPTRPDWLPLNGLPSALVNNSKLINICTLGEFSINKQGVPIPCPRGSISKPLELLKALVANGNKQVRRDWLCEILWPDAEGDYAQQTLDITLHRLRKLVGEHQFVEVRNGKVALNESLCTVDVWYLEDTCDFLHSGDVTAGIVSEKMMNHAAEVLFCVYRGDFLDTDSDTHWTFLMRDKLRQKFIRSMASLAKYWHNRGNITMALELYLRGLEINPLLEEFYQNAIQCHVQLGHSAEALVLYQRCRMYLHQFLGIHPSKRTQSLCDKLTKL